MILEINGTEEYTVIKEYDLSEYSGKYRMVLYSSGYYGIQKFINQEWEVILVSPIKNKLVFSEDSKFLVLNIDKGYLIVNDILNCIEEADNSFNGKYWQLNLYLSEGGEETFTEIITHGDGEELLGQIKELYEWEKKEMELYYDSFPTIKKVNYIFGIIGVLILVSYLVIYLIFNL